MSKRINQLMLVFTYYIVCAASFSAFIAKWGFRDIDNRFSFSQMINGTAFKPFVYRRLLFDICDKIPQLLPDAINTKLIALVLNHDYLGLTYKNVHLNNNPFYMLDYYILYYLTFIFFFLAALIIQNICEQVTGNKIASIFATLIFILIFPIFETVGGYCYDFSELFFMALFLLLLLRHNYYWLLVVAFFATLNKETFIFFILTQYPFFQLGKNRRLQNIILSLTLIISGSVNLFIKHQYAHNPGGMMEHYLLQQLEYIINYKNYIAFEVNYGMPVGTGFFIVYILFIFQIVKQSWGSLPAEWKKYSQVCMILNCLLFLCFVWPGELRDLSFLYLPFIVMLAFFIKNFITKIT